MGVVNVMQHKSFNYSVIYMFYMLNSLWCQKRILKEVTVIACGMKENIQLDLDASVYDPYPSRLLLDCVGTFRKF